MKNCCFYLYFFCLSYVFGLYEIKSSYNNDDLVSVVVISRHGDRSPEKIYPTDPHKEYQWPMGLAQLTNQGKQRSFEIGKWLRLRYDGFLSRSYNRTDIKVYSTNLDRTLMSAEATLAGLYQPESDQIWNKDINWQPIPIWIVSPAMMNGHKNCKKYQKIYKDLLANNTFFTKINTKNIDIYKYLSDHSGWPVKNFVDASKVWGVLFVEDHNNLTLPNWTSSVYPDKLQSFEELKFLSLGYTEELVKLIVGGFFNEVAQFFSNHRNQTPEVVLEKVKIFSAHDSTIVTILNGLGAFTPHCPYYGSSLIFELHRKSDSLLVNVLYKTHNGLIPLNIERCGKLCNLEDFLSLLSNVTITEEEWKTQCL